MGLIVALLMLEAALTITGRVFKPDQKTYAGLERRAELADADLVIACFGDSQTFGLGASSPKFTYPSQLESLLSARYPDLKIHVMNHGVPGANSSQHVKYLKEFLPAYPRPPDIVHILSFGPNEWNLSECSALLDGYAKLPSNKHFFKNIEKVRIGKLAVLLRLNLNRDKLAMNLAQVDFREQGPHVQALLNMKNAEDREFLSAWIAHDMHEMRKAVESAGSRTTLFGLYGRGPTQDVNSLIRESAAQASIPVCEPSPMDEDEWLSKGFWNPVIQHPNDLGYAKIAESIADCLTSNHLIPETARPRP